MHRLFPYASLISVFISLSTSVSDLHQLGLCAERRLLLLVHSVEGTSISRWTRADRRSSIFMISGCCWLTIDFDLFIGINPICIEKSIRSILIFLYSLICFFFFFPPKPSLLLSLIDDGSTMESHRRSVSILCHWYIIRIHHGVVYTAWAPYYCTRSLNVCVSRYYIM